MAARRKKTKTKTKTATDRIKGAAKSAASVSAEKTREAIQFVYKHRKKITDALELIAAVVGTASTAIGRPSPSRRSRRRRKR